jgi:DNA-binding protein YbaB
VTDHRAQVEELLADYRRSREHLAQAQQELASITGTARSEDGGVEVVVGAQGTMRNLVLADNVYQRQRPSQLAATILRLTAEAAAAASARAADVVAPVLPAGTDPEAIFAGRADLDPPPPVRDDPPHGAGKRDDNAPHDNDEEDFSEDSGWLQDGSAKRTYR